MGGPLWSIAYVIHNQRAIVNGSLQWIQLDGPCFCACTMLHAVFVHHLVSCAHWLISQQTYRTCKPAQGKQRCKCRALTARYDRAACRTDLSVCTHPGSNGRQTLKLMLQQKEHHLYSSWLLAVSAAGTELWELQGSVQRTLEFLENPLSFAPGAASDVGGTSYPPRVSFATAEQQAAQRWGVVRSRDRIKSADHF
eukprot:1136789-Pelagomonas_calceolata.AAC.10